MKNIWIKIKMVSLILFRRHIIIIEFDTKTMKDIIKEEKDFRFNLSYVGLRHYQLLRVFKMIGSGIKDEELILRKAEFEFDYEEYQKGKL